MEIYRGDIFFVTGSGGRITGAEIKQDRPAIVVSNDKANEHSPVIEVVFLTSQEKSRYLPTHVDVMCQIPSVALCEQVHSISKTRLGLYVRTCSHKEMQEIDKALMISLGLEAEVKETKDEEFVPVISDQIEIATLKAERDTYKQQYELLLDRLIGK